MGWEIHQVDAFTESAFSGNPAAVVVLPQGAADLDWAYMQRLAAEMNLSETAFVRLAAEGPHGLRWFTPVAEVDLCGHATLASAHVLWSAGHATVDELEFSTRSGILGAARDAGWIVLDFPQRSAERRQPPGELIEALGTNPVGCFLTGENDWLVELPSVGEVLDLVPDFPYLRRVDCRGVMVTAAGGVAERCPNADFVSRFFALQVGVDEDPVTGSAHCALATFWAPRLKKDELLAFQASRRGGEVRVRLVDGGRVKLAGQAVTVFSGTLGV